MLGEEGTGKKSILYEIQTYIIAACLLKAKTMKPVDTAVTEERFRKRACFHSNNLIQ
jgi:hypothetical protein